MDKIGGSKQEEIGLIQVQGWALVRWSLLVEFMKKYEWALRPKNKQKIVCPNKEMKKRIGRSIFFSPLRHFEKKT